MVKPRYRGMTERFAAYTDVVPDGCWTWMGYRVKGGYGAIPRNTQADRANHSSNLAHRISYELHVGPIPEGLTIDHLCGNPSCVRPDHLEPVTMAENIRRGKGANKSHCTNGHEYTTENTYIMPSGFRDCRQCIYDRSRARHDREKAKSVKCRHCNRRTRHESGTCHTHRFLP